MAIARKFGAPIPQLLAHVGVRSEVKSHKVRVDQFGNGVASAPGVKGSYVTVARDAMKQVSISGVPVKGDNPFNTCSRAFGDCLKGGLRRALTKILRHTYKN